MQTYLVTCITMDDDELKEAEKHLKQPIEVYNGSQMQTEFEVELTEAEAALVLNLPSVTRMDRK